MREGLPAAWQALVDSDGKTYYANHESRTTTFDRPEDITGELPAGWEMLRTPQGVAYFADHNTHTATWDDPRSA
jgi:atrophin-1 interacting protein 5 (WW domain-containing E3 ubiquitin protein ligase 1)